MLRRARLATLAALCSALLGPSACAKGEPSPAPQASPTPLQADDPAPVSGPPAAASEARAAADPTVPAVPGTGAGAVADASMAAVVAALARSEAKMTIKASIANESGFRLEPLTGMHALAVTPGRPGFAAPLSDAARAQDDDFLTAATCAHGQAGGQPCALGLALPQGAEVTMLRLFLAAGPDYRDYVGAPRPKRLAIHTDAGRTEVDYPDGATDRYIIFAEPVTTAGLSLEILDVYPGRKSAEIHFAEIEVYGTKGDARPPLDGRLDEAFVYFETHPWKHTGGGHHTVMMTWLERLGYKGVVDRPGPRRRWIRGMAAYGDDKDRLVLIERGLSSSCDAPEVGYLMIDKQTRMVYPLGTLAGGGAAIHRHSGGLGFLAAPPGDGEAAVAGIRSIVFDPESRSFTRRRGKKTWTLADHLREWSFDERARRPGGRDLDTFVADPESHCEVLADEGLAAALASSEVFSEETPGQWWSCGIGDGHRALLGRDRACGEAVSILLKTPEGQLIRRAEFAAGAGARRVAIEAKPAFPGLLVEVGKEAGAASDVVPVNIDYYEETILRDASLAVRPPAECGACLLEYAAAQRDVGSESAPEPSPSDEPDDG